ncbi:MAG: hypothetical protein AB4050_16935 [Synechococcus sp.]
MSHSRDNHHPSQPKPVGIFKLSEYASAGASVVGTIAAALTKEFLYAATPLSFSLFLNLISRQRLENQFRNNERINLHLEESVAKLDKRINAMQHEWLPDLKTDLAKITQKLNDINQSRIDPALKSREIAQELQQLKKRFEREIELIRNSLLESPKLKEERLDALLQVVDSLKGQISAIEDDVRSARGRGTLGETFDRKLEELKKLLQIEFQTEIADRIGANERVSQVEQQLQQLQVSVRNDFERLRHEQVALRESTTQQPFDELQHALESIRERLERIDLRVDSEVSEFQEKHSVFEENLEGLRQEFKQELSNIRLRAVEQLNALHQPQLQELRSLLDELQSRLDAYEPAGSQALGIQIEPSSPNIETISSDRILIPDDISTSVEEEWGDSSTGFAEATEDVDVLDLNIGIDFGTQFTKACFRDVAQERSEIVSFEKNACDLESGMLTSKVGILNDGTLIAGVTEKEWQSYQSDIGQPVEYIKMRLAYLDTPDTLDGWELESIPELEDPEVIENICAYFLSQVICRTQEWIVSNKKDLIVNQKLYWTANVGVPVEYRDSNAKERFEKVLSLAWLLSNEAKTDRMRLDNLKERMIFLRKKLQETKGIDCHAVPEIAAEVWSFINSRQVDDGFYILFDIGDGTLDGNAFYYWRDEGEPRVDFYKAIVKPLGVAAFIQQLQDELKHSENAYRHLLFGDSNRIPIRVSSSQSFKRIQQLVAQVVFRGVKEYRRHHKWESERDLKDRLKFFLGGGGSISNLYIDAVKSTHKDFNHQSSNIPVYQQVSIPFPDDLEVNGLSRDKFYRFAVAYGLSIPQGESAEVRLPSEMESIEYNRTVLNSTYNVENYDDSRGSW